MKPGRKTQRVKLAGVCVESVIYIFSHVATILERDKVVHFQSDVLSCTVKAVSQRTGKTLTATISFSSMSFEVLLGS